MFNKTYKSSSYVAFTLAEVLLTLGIIGIVAALTIPVLLNSYQKNVTIEKFKKTYATVSNALKLSEVDNGFMLGWDVYGGNIDLAATQYFADKFLYPYLKTSRTCSNGSVDCWIDPVSLSGISASASAGPSNQKSNALSAVLLDGTSILFWVPSASNNSIQLWFNIDGVKSKNNVIGKNIFTVRITPTDSSATARPGLSAAGLWKTLDRTELTDNSSFGCSDSSVGAWAGTYCSGLIISDGWRISDDYPWR